MNLFGAVMCMGTAVLAVVTCEGESREVTVRTPSGDNMIMEVQPDDKFLDVLGHIETTLNDMGEGETQDFEEENGSGRLALEYCQRPFIMDYMAAGPGLVTVGDKGTTEPRNYNAALKSSEKKDIKYIVTTLGNGSLREIVSSKSSLKKAGDRVLHVHPLRFLAYIFSDEEMKAAMANLQGRSWVWKEYLGSTSDSLDKELSLNNLIQFIPDFSTTLNVDSVAVNGFALDRKWSSLIDYLIKTIPRKGDTGRYDM